MYDSAENILFQNAFCILYHISLSCVLADLICIVGFCRHLETQSGSGCTLCIRLQDTIVRSFNMSVNFVYELRTVNCKMHITLPFLTVFCNVLP